MYVQVCVCMCVSLGDRYVYVCVCLWEDDVCVSGRMMCVCLFECYMVGMCVGGLTVCTSICTCTGV